MSARVVLDSSLVWDCTLAERGQLRLLDHHEITVCSHCLRASCWAGTLMCDSAQSAGTKRISVGRARRLNREHPSYWVALRRAEGVPESLTDVARRHEATGVQQRRRRSRRRPQPRR